MKKLFDKNGLLNIEDIIMNTPSFQKIVEDSVITEEEIRELYRKIMRPYIR